MLLNQSNLAKIKERIPVPSNKRNRLKHGIVHIGVGGFHRSHQAFYINELLKTGEGESWGICGIGLRHYDRKIAQVLQEQDCLYTLIVQNPDGSEKAEIIGSICDFLFAPDDPKRVIEKMADPDVKIISLTITEGGYNYDMNTGEFDFSNPDIQHELLHPDDPKSVYGYLIAALRLRRDRQLSPVTIMSCDNIQHNGDVMHRMLMTFAERQDPSLARWIDQELSFPNTMVDRITPVSSQVIVNKLYEDFQLIDEWPVICEPFIQWVIEDKFVHGQPQVHVLEMDILIQVHFYKAMQS